MNTTYVIITVVVLVAVIAALAYLHGGVPSIGVSGEDVNALGTYGEINAEQNIGADVLPSESEMNIDVNEVVIELPSEI